MPFFQIISGTGEPVTWTSIFPWLPIIPEQSATSPISGGVPGTWSLALNTRVGSDGPLSPSLFSATILNSYSWFSIKPLTSYSHSLIKSSEKRTNLCSFLLLISTWYLMIGNPPSRRGGLQK